VAGRLYVGTSGFAYPDWVPRFYPERARSADLLRLYATRLPAVELNNTFYRQPRPERVAAWLTATPSSFRFAVKAQRGSSMRCLGERAAADAVAWLMPAYRRFGERLGSVLFHIPEQLQRDDARLATLLAAWPPDMPLALEFQHPSWLDDEVLAMLSDKGAALCATDRDDAPLPDIRLTGPFVYLRLRRSTYTQAELDAWAARLEPFLADGRDAFVFLRHDADGQAALNAELLAAGVAGAPGA
jgi:uncharacterized protein YecE (DUF72 family)